MDDKSLRKQLADLLEGRGAHVEFKAAFASIPEKLRGIRPKAAPHSLWELLEHMRIAQWDVLEFSRDPEHFSPDWPAGYWPKSPAPAKGQWDKTIKAFKRDLESMKKLVSSAKTDLFAPIPHGDGQTIFRETLLIADHNSYHLGQVIVVRRLLGAWKED